MNILASNLNDGRGEACAGHFISRLDPRTALGNDSTVVEILGFAVPMGSENRFKGH